MRDFEKIIKTEIFAIVSQETFIIPHTIYTGDKKMQHPIETFKLVKNVNLRRLAMGPRGFVHFMCFP